MGHVQVVLIGHEVNSPNVSAHIKLGPKIIDIWGHSVSIMEIGRPVVTLLAEGSTPQGGTIRADAEAEFQGAAEVLIREGIEFYTVLRPDWMLRAILWTRTPR